MADFRDRIDESTLAQLRRHVGTLMSNNGPGLLAPEIVDFCANVKAQHGVTIDLQALRDLGEPLVIIHPAAPARALRKSECMTPREREVALLVCEGLSNKDIAKTLCISLATVKDHVHRILGKSGLPTRVALAACYVNSTIPDEGKRAHPSSDGCAAKRRVLPDA